MSPRPVWKIRIRRNYAEATNHVVVGEVLTQTPEFIRLRCRAFHFRRPTTSAHIASGDVQTRVFPWATIAYATELADGFNWELARAELTREGDVVLIHPDSTAPVALRENLDA